MLTLEHVSKTYKVGAFGGGSLVAVREVDFTVAPGEVVSLIGESGSGKSTIGKMILRLISVNGGRILFDGTDISTLKGHELNAYYRAVTGVFQDPFSSFNPVFKVSHVFDMLRGRFGGSVEGRTWDERVGEALESVGLEGGQLLHKYPHQLSGGQLQRLLIARALLLDTKMLVADEVISMLDASTRIDVLNLLADLKGRGLGIMFITHDLSLGNYISEKTVILRRGLIVEMGATSKVFGSPTHPYTKMLLASVPQLHRKWQEIADELKMSEEDIVNLEAASKQAFESVGEILAPDAPDSVLTEIDKDHLVRFSPEEAKEKAKTPARKKA